MAKPTQAQIDAKDAKLAEVQEAYHAPFMSVEKFRQLLNTIPYSEITDAQWDRAYAIYLTRETTLKTKVTAL